jgi:hypothetical protein
VVATDLAEAHWLGCSYVITAVAQGQSDCQTNSFYLAGDTEEDKRFEQETDRSDEAAIGAAWG